MQSNWIVKATVDMPSRKQMLELASAILITINSRPVKEAQLLLTEQSSPLTI